MARILRHQWFLLVLAAVLAIGFLFSEALAELPDAFPKRLLVAGVLFLMAWTLDTSAMFRAVRRPTAAALGVAVNMVLLPLLAWGVITVFPTRFDDGILLMAVIPCTLASAAVWTRRAGGNDAVALMVTMITNFTCFLTTPLWLWLAAGRRVEMPSIMQELLLIAVLPMVLGQLLRLFDRAADWAGRHKQPLGVCAQFGILTMVLLGAITSAEALRSNGGQDRFGPAVWLGLLLITAGLHVTALLAGLFLARLLRLPAADASAVGIAGSQKTLMIGLQLATQYAHLFGPLAALPMVVYHVLQLLIDTLVADRLARRSGRAPRSEESTRLEEEAPDSK